MKKILLMATAIGLMSSCSIYRSFKSPEVEIRSVIAADVSTVDSSATIAPWQDVFSDAPLEQLLRKGIEANSDLQIARKSIEQAEAMLLSSKLAYLPSFSLSPQGTVSQSGSHKASLGYSLPLTTQWELDLFGKLRNSKQQARYSLMQSAEYAKMVQTQLVASIANSYYTLVMLDQQLKITMESIENQKQNMDVIIAMKQAGLQTETAVNQATANYYNIQTSAKELQMQIKLTENSIALLINQPPHHIERTSMEQSKGLSIDYNQPIPLRALANRPDVKDAEYALGRSFYAVNSANSAFYPSISLSGSAGWTNSIGAISNPASMLFSAIGTLTQPLFNKGVNRANLKIAKSQYDQSMIAFEKALLVAGSEVNNALINCQNSAAKEELRQKQVEASEMAYSNSVELMKHSSVTYLEILVAQNSMLQAKLMQVSDWMEGVQGEISLYKSLGGGVQ